MSIPRDHHFIPVFYLKGWVNEQEKLIEYSRPYRNRFVAKPVGPRATGFQTDLYAFDECPPELAQYLEAEFLKRADDLAARALQKLLAGDLRPWTNELRSAWSRFTMNFFIRHPDPLAEIKRVTHDNWLRQDEVTRREYERLREPHHPERFEDWVIAQGDNLADRIRINFLQVAMDNERIGNRFNNLKWNVLDLSASPFKLMTSDWPVTRNIEGERMLFMLPISPTAVFTAVSHVDIFERVRRMSPKELATKMNREVVSRARRYVYSVDRSQDQFIANRMSTGMIVPPFFPSLVRGG